MNSVLISIKPKYCELIASGKKTIEVRKTKPKLETPFKVYIYCTKNKNGITNCKGNEILNGKVIGEFVCDWVESTVLWRIKGNTGFCAKRTEREEMLPKMACLSIEELEKYASSENRNIYGWHISNLVIYDKPKELSEFYIPIKDYWESYEPQSKYFSGCWKKPVTRPPQSWCYVESECE